MNHLQFFAVGTPKAQPRPKASRHGGFVRMYDPGSAKPWKECVAAAVDAAVPKDSQYPLFSSAVRIDIQIYFPRPKSHYRTNGDLKPTAPNWHTSKPDRDNCDKAILDCLKVKGVLSDDCIVCAGEITKYYTVPTMGHKPGARINILSLNEPI